MRWISVLAVLVASATASAGEVFTALVTHQAGSYTVEVDALVESPEPAVRALLTDFSHLERVHPAVQSSEILAEISPGHYRVRMVTKACVWFFCKRIKQVQTMVEGIDGSITATVDPAQSDLKHGYARIELWQEQLGTRVLIRSEVEPDFWIPPVIGPWFIMRRLRSEALETVYNLERLAHAAILPHNTSRQDSTATLTAHTDP
jgi:hypothetical protein